MIVGGIDMGLRALGFTRFDYNLINHKLAFLDMELIETERRVAKVVRANSDDLRRSQELWRALHRNGHRCDLLFAEIPSGAQSARAAHSFGIVTGLLAAMSVTTPLIQVQPTETKLHTVGTKTASKQEMIEWAAETYPDAPWLRKKVKGVMKVIDKNEHLADACAVVHAGLKTDQFQQLVAMRWADTPVAA